jgi:endogenous inhibitor of DNA gyrase (YacG/DUF329 family)
MARCPTCKRPLPEAASGLPLPFCSQRCKLVDLDGWLSERYVVSEALPFDPDQAPDVPPGEG